MFQVRSAALVLVLGALVSVGLVGQVDANPSAASSASAVTRAGSPAGPDQESARVSGKYRVSASGPRSILRGRVVTVSGAVTPKRAGAVVRLQRRDGRTWTTVATGRTSSSSRYRMSHRPLTGTSAVYRVFLPSTPPAVSKPVSVRLVVNGTSSAPRAGTITPAAASVQSVTGDPTAAQVTVLDPGTAAPPVGGVLVLAPSTHAPEGVLGRVTGREATPSGGWRVSTVPATLDQAFADFTVSAHTNITDDMIVSQGRSGAGAAAKSAGLGSLFSDGPFKCEGSSPLVKIKGGFKVLGFDFSMDVASRSLRFGLVGKPFVTIEGALGGKASCVVESAVLLRIPTPSPAVFVEVRPALTFSATGKVAARITWSSDYQYFFSAVRGQVTYVNKESSTVTPELSSDASVQLKVRAGLKVDLTLAGRVGIGGTLGPVVTATATVAPDQTCLALAAALAADIHAKADVFVAKWEIVLVEGELSPTEIWRKCWPGTTPTPTPTPPVSSSVDVLPAGICGAVDPVRLTGDHGIATDARGNSWTVYVPLDKVVYGQVDNTGPLEIGITVLCGMTNGGNGVWGEAYLLRAHGTEPTLVQEVVIPESVDPGIGANYPNDFDWIELRDGRVTVGIRYYHDNDYHCCMTGRATATFLWTGSALQFEGIEVNA